jgi:hypothetical protein
MDIMIVCGSPNPGGPEYALAVVLGLMLDIAIWVRHRHLASRSAARQILPIR